MAKKKKKKKSDSEEEDIFEEEMTQEHLMLMHVFEVIHDRDETIEALLEEQGALFDRLSEVETEVSELQKDLEVVLSLILKRGVLVQ